MQQALSVVVPAYNEANNLRSVVLELLETLESLDTSYEIIVVNDGSTDQTGAIVNDLDETYSTVRVLHHRINQGLGAALITGFNASQGKWIAVVPGDGQADPRDFQTFIAEFDNADFIAGYYVNRDYGFRRKVLSWGLRALLSILFGQIPRLEGTRFFRRKLLDTIGLDSQTGLVNLEFLIKAQRRGYRVREVPVHFRPRLSGESKVANCRTILRHFREIIKLRLTLNKTSRRAVE